MGCLARQRILTSTKIKMEELAVGPLLANKETHPLLSHHVKNPLTFQNLNSQATCQRLCLKHLALKDHPYQLIFQ